MHILFALYEKVEDEGPVVYPHYSMFILNLDSSVK